jgi:maleylpyruvate isomerase
MKLYDYWRSSAAYRVRIALNLKGLQYDAVPVNLVKNEQAAPAFTAQNPQGLVPLLVNDKGAFSQSLAIIEYLNELHLAPPLLPSDLEARAHARAIAYAIACELHPVNNLRIRNYLSSPLHLTDTQKSAWITHWLKDGFSALETMVKQVGSTRKFCIGGAPTLADICLIPQLYTARRFMTDFSAYPTLVAIDAHCRTLPAFINAQPENQPDAE